MVAPPFHDVSHVLSSKSIKPLAEFDIHVTGLSVVFDLTTVFCTHPIAFVLKTLVLDLIVTRALCKILPNSPNSLSVASDLPCVSGIRHWPLTLRCAGGGLPNRFALHFAGGGFLYSFLVGCILAQKCTNRAIGKLSFKL